MKESHVNLGHKMLSIQEKIDVKRLGEVFSLFEDVDKKVQTQTYSGNEKSLEIVEIETHESKACLRAQEINH